MILFQALYDKGLLLSQFYSTFRILAMCFPFYGLQELVYSQGEYITVKLPLKFCHIAPIRARTGVKTPPLRVRTW